MQNNNNNNNKKAKGKQENISRQYQVLVRIQSDWNPYVMTMGG